MEVQTRQHVHAEDVWRAELVHKYSRFLRKPRLHNLDAGITQDFTATSLGTLQTGEKDAGMSSTTPPFRYTEETSSDHTSCSDEASADPVTRRSDASSAPRAVPTSDRQTVGAPGDRSCERTDEIVANGRPWEQGPERDLHDPKQGEDDEKGEAQDHVSTEGCCEGPDVVEDDKRPYASESDSDPDSTDSCSDTDEDEGTEDGEEPEDEEEDNEDEVLTV